MIQDKSVTFINPFIPKIDTPIVNKTFLDYRKDSQCGDTYSGPTKSINSSSYLAGQKFTGWFSESRG